MKSKTSELQQLNEPYANISSKRQKVDASTQTIDELKSQSVEQDQLKAYKEQLREYEEYVAKINNGMLL